MPSFFLHHLRIEGTETDRYMGYAVGAAVENKESLGSFELVPLAEEEIAPDAMPEPSSDDASSHRAPSSAHVPVAAEKRTRLRKKRTRK